MICAPRFVASAQLVPLVVQSVTAVAPVAAPAVFEDIVAAVLKRIAFGDVANKSLNTAAGNALTRLAARVGDRRDLVEGFFCAVLRFFVDTSIAFPAPSRFRRRELTPLAVLLPVLHALVCTRAYALDREADVEQISLWRNFWLHMAARGYLLEKSYVAAYGRIYAALAARSPILVHPSSVNYLVTEIEYSSVLQRESSDASLARLHRALAPLSSTQSLPLLRTVSFAQAAFLFAAYSVELARASAGNCATVLAYFGNSAVATSPLLPAIESIATLVIAAYVRETTSRKWSLSAVSHEPPAVVTQVRELMVASCHHLQLVSTWAQRFVDRIMHAFPQALLDPSAVRMLLELVQLVWKSCKAEQDDQFVPVYWFTSRTLNLTLQFPDSISYRKALFTSFSACAKRWLEIAAAAAPMELEAMLQVYLSSPSDDDLNYEPHIGHSLALEVANSIRYSRGPPVEVDSSAIVLPPNSSSFIYRLGQRDFLRGCIGRGTDATSLKSLLSDVYVAAKERPGEPLPEDFPSMREITETMSHAAHYLVATPRIDRELARLLVWVPLTLLDDSLMRATGHAWTMLIVERPDVEVLIMVELTIAWTWLIQQHLGLFSKRFEPRSPFAAKMSYTPSDKSARAHAYAVISHTLAPHMLLIEFLAQRFDSVKHLPYCNFAVISAILRILQATFDNVDCISSNALARGPLFMLVHLGFKLLKLGFESSPILEAKLRDGLYDLAFRWFALPPCWSFSGSKATLAKEIHILIDTRHTVKSDSPVLRSASSQLRNAAAEHDMILDTSREQLMQQALRNRSLLLVLLENEICRMATWANPTDQSIGYFPDVSRFARNAEMSDSGWQNLVVDAWTASPRLAVQLIQRFSHPAVRRELVSLICKFPGELVQEPEALPLLIEQLHFGTDSGSLAYFLLYWCAVPPITAMSYLASSHSRHPLALQYSMRSLECFPVDTTFFYIPQMVQALRHDSDGYVERAILSSAQISQHFAHQIIWNMKANVYRDEEGQEPDSLKPVLDRIVDTIVDDLSGDDRAYYEMEFRFFGEITGISGKLKPFIKKSKSEKKRKIDEELRQIKVEPGVYLPSNPDGTVVDIDYDSGRPLQSHAKAPFMATFVINRPRVASDEVQELLKRQEEDYEVTRLSAIFKVGDDCRQDVLALQLIAVFKNIFTSCGLDLYLYPYRVVATAPGRGVIDVIPNSISRDQMGREKVNSLSDYFATRYHGVDSIQYQQARTNFVQSLAAYSVLSYLLQFKDRHNGNIMLDDEGHIVHIDFGFILDIAPGGITFESAPFKLTTEYVQVMGGSIEAQPYRLFCELCIKAYLACRPYAEKIIQVVALMLDSGLPCFKGESTLLKLRSRFQLDRTERDAAQFMADRISDSHENKRTVMYDQFQKATNGIPY
ncbi:hypothetical protein COEREDRAFT_41956 [Coemansia reversa NRRL 1564]|uniref:1-phosphatidylinositol 4-kinase n=1 Tax=Coemansia reversa (strain ATCC 12441 / NRRL 1564) TaxID=763665 RepID=A0A2G5BCY2_COERN|nr:hypothetical protein COEREDRAFT_41956 [Coemansia reversa NRRL 1564]|eukprot:PIA16863.1 hypothetical protein COEREDRAFT_41956 [Coemansia reversa NRRL 1564]